MTMLLETVPLYTFFSLKKRPLFLGFKSLQQELVRGLLTWAALLPRQEMRQLHKESSDRVTSMQLLLNRFLMQPPLAMPMRDPAAACAAEPVQQGSTARAPHGPEPATMPLPYTDPVDSTVCSTAGTDAMTMLPASREPQLQAINRRSQPLAVSKKAQAVPGGTLHNRRETMDTKVAQRDQKPDVLRVALEPRAPWGHEASASGAWRGAEGEELPRQSIPVPTCPQNQSHRGTTVLAAAEPMIHISPPQKAEQHGGLDGKENRVRTGLQQLNGFPTGSLTGKVRSRVPALAASNKVGHLAEVCS